MEDQLLAHVEPADEMGRDADRAEKGVDMLGDAVVEHALAGDGALLLGVERGRVVLEILDERAGLRALVEDLGLAFVDQSAAGHSAGASGFMADGPGVPGLGRPGLLWSGGARAKRGFPVRGWSAPCRRGSLGDGPGACMDLRPDSAGGLF